MIAHNKPTIEKAEISASDRVLKSGMLSQGKEVEYFENEICEFLNLPEGHAVSLSSGTSSLYMALHCLKSSNTPNTVGIPSYVCSALKNAINLNNDNETIIDITNNSPNIDINELNIKNPDIAIIPHMYGIEAELNKINKNITVIEDCAQSLGLKIGKQYAGTVGDLGIISFYATKLITSGGQGGMVISKNKNLIDMIKDYREFDCRNDKKERFNFQMTDLQASIGREQLKKLPMFLKRREEIFKMYLDNGLPMLWNDKNAVRYRAVMHTANPKDITKKLEEKGIKTIIPIEDWELLETTPNAYNLAQSTISLPIYPLLSDNEIKKIIKEIKSI